jgi:hypothetical protein
MRWYQQRVMLRLEKRVLNQLRRVARWLISLNSFVMLIVMLIERILHSNLASVCSF